MMKQWQNGNEFFSSPSMAHIFAICKIHRVWRGFEGFVHVKIQVFLCKVDRENWFRTRFQFHFSISCLVNISIYRQFISLSAFSSSLLLIPRVILISTFLFLFFSLLFSILRQVYCVPSRNLNKQLQGRKTISRKCWIRQGFSDFFLSHQLTFFNLSRLASLSRIYKKVVVNKSEVHCHFVISHHKFRHLIERARALDGTVSLTSQNNIRSENNEIKVENVRKIREKKVITTLK